MNRPSRRRIRTAGVVGLALLASTWGGAQELDSEAVIKYRQGLMKAQAGLMAATAQIVRGKVDHQAQLAFFAEALQQLIVQTTSAFPEGSDFGETDAKAAIWEQWDKFEESAKKAQIEAEGFAKAVSAGDNKKIGASFKALAEACKGCHKDFREEEE